jgi:hypothetical protein
VWAAFPLSLTRHHIPAASDYYAPSDSLRVHWDFVRVAPYLLPTSLHISLRVSRVHRIGRISGMFYGGVFPHAPSTLCGFPDFHGVISGLPMVPFSCQRHELLLLPTGQDRGFGRLADISSKVCQGSSYPQGYSRFLRITFIPSQAHTSWRLASSSWRLLGACCSHREVARAAQPQRLIGYLHTQWRLFSAFLSRAFTAHLALCFLCFLLIFRRILQIGFMASRPSPSGCCASLDTRLFAVEALRKKEAKKKPQRASRGSGRATP